MEIFAIPWLQMAAGPGLHDTAVLVGKDTLGSSGMIEIVAVQMPQD